jgi:hypothetical protein
MMGLEPRSREMRRAREEAMRNRRTTVIAKPPIALAT